MRPPQIAIARPYLGDEEKAAVLAVLDSGLLTQGSGVAEFERAFAERQAAGFGVATSSGTAALVVALLAHGIGAGDEVIVPSFSFFATASAVLFVGARPVFADIDPETFCLSPDAAEAALTPRTRAIIVVHLFGHPADMPRFAELCARHGLALVEDAAQAVGASTGERAVGTWGTGAFSFHATKNMTTMEGGMVLASDADVARRARLLRQQGMSAPHVHEMVGTNLRMTEVAAAIGLVQLRRLPEWQAKRRDNAAYYATHLKGVAVPQVRPGITHAYQQYTLRVPAAARARLIEELGRSGIEARAYYATPIHRQPVIVAMGAYANLALPETERAAREVLSIPVHPGVDERQREVVARELHAALALVS